MFPARGALHVRRGSVPLCDAQFIRGEERWECTWGRRCSHTTREWKKPDGAVIKSIGAVGGLEWFSGEVRQDREGLVLRKSGGALFIPEVTWFTAEERCSTLPVVAIGSGAQELPPLDVEGLADGGALETTGPIVAVVR